MAECKWLKDQICTNKDSDQYMDEPDGIIYCVLKCTLFDAERGRNAPPMPPEP